MSGATRHMDDSLPLLVKEQDVGAALKKSVGGGETGKTASDNDDLCHYSKMDVGWRWWWGGYRSQGLGRAGEFTL